LLVSHSAWISPDSFPAAPLRKNHTSRITGLLVGILSLVVGALAKVHCLLDETIHT
jgi:hypothetical protein